MTDEKKSAIQYMKDNPFIALPLQAYKVRRNMLLCAILCWFQVVYGKLGGVFKIFNQDLPLPKSDFNTVLIVITGYFLTYFSVLAWPTMKEWRLRSTTTHETIVDPEEEADILWKGDFSNVNNIPQDRIRVGQTLAWPKISTKLAFISDKFDSIQKEIQAEDKATFSKITNALDAVNKAKDSLAVYDDECCGYQKSLKRSFWIWEFGGPIAFGGIGFVILAYRTSPAWIKSVQWMIIKAYS